MDFQFSVVFDIAQFAEFVHEEAHARSGRADHLRERFLTELSDGRLRLAVFTEICKKKQKTGEALFARIKQLVDQVLFNSAVSSQEIRHKQYWLLPRLGSQAKMAHPTFRSSDQMRPSSMRTTTIIKMVPRMPMPP